eukprot:CAMPEP_0206489538 /NCGR_PEP_ID=MMETSP0324_2-20121206/43327_1 /ASSEMBLY_ACC=CAM_ASM_000836 /TAXON_ID=2866 /ORGANISM="Crypthecodinium cohnii, Strain Seligo" /LENGTH=30 /DNA_ID= /DNA_START= /DNA_END= /DNA_ORIENTATION=
MERQAVTPEIVGMKRMKARGHAQKSIGKST